MPAKQVVVRAVFRRCTAPESLNDAEQLAAVRCKPSLPTVLMLRAPSSNAVPHRTGNCQATPAAVVRCKQQEPTPVQSLLPAGVSLATATKAQQAPSSQPSASAALPRHRQKPPIATTTRHCHRPRWVSENDASKEVTTPKAPPSLVQKWTRLSPREPAQHGWCYLMTPPTGRKTPSDAVAIAASKTFARRIPSTARTQP